MGRCISYKGNDVYVTIAINDVTGKNPEDVPGGAVIINLGVGAEVSHATANPSPWFTDSRREMFLFTNDKDMNYHKNTLSLLILQLMKWDIFLASMMLMEINLGKLYRIHTLHLKIWL